jgi:hypothetical protein
VTIKNAALPEGFFNEIGAGLPVQRAPGLGRSCPKPDSSLKWRSAPALAGQTLDYSNQSRKSIVSSA